MINAIDWFKEKGFTFDDKITIKDVIDLQTDARADLENEKRRLGEALDYAIRKRPDILKGVAILLGKEHSPDCDCTDCRWMWKGILPRIPKPT